MKKILLLPISLLTLSLNAQMSGNEMYGNVNYNQYNGYNNYYQQTSQYLQLNSNTDSTYYIQAKILMNVQPDEFVATISVQQEALTVKECNSKINLRIDSFKKSLAELGIKSDDIYVDMVAQAKVYDYNVAGKTATEVSKGFEIKKNVIFKFTDPNMMDDIMVAASEYEIYDIVKVDYIVTDQQKIYDQMIAEIDKLVEKKKATANSLSEMTLLNDSRLATQNFYAIYPDESYKSYTASESADASYYGGYNSSDSYWKKEQRKSKTFYFDKQNYSGFDKIINPTSVKIPVQFVLDVQIKYTLKCDYCMSQQPKKAVEPNKK
jgi:uncharacterized protein YggE